MTLIETMNVPLQIGLTMARVTAPVVTDDLTGVVVLERDAVRMEVKFAGMVLAVDLSEDSWLAIRDQLPQALLEAFQLQDVAVKPQRKGAGGRPAGRPNLFDSEEAARALAGAKRVIARENVMLSYYRNKIAEAETRGLLLEVEETHRVKSHAYGRVLLSPL